MNTGAYLLRINILNLFCALLFLAGCEAAATDSMEVTASAYNSVPSQTTNDYPALAAWGDRLKPGMKCIAVSRDLIKLGLTHNTKVKIDGLPGTYLVKDKMNKRWQKKIDIYMGDDVVAAKEWGVREVTISWSVVQE
jgi:3D (Asp-Asp-Asp) domain-containing protein